MARNSCRTIFLKRATTRASDQARLPTAVDQQTENLVPRNLHRTTACNLAPLGVRTKFAPDWAAVERAAHVRRVPAKVEVHAANDHDDRKGNAKYASF